RAAVEEPAEARGRPGERPAHGLREPAPDLADAQRVADGGDERDAVDAVLAHLREQAVQRLEPWIEVVMGVDDHAGDLSVRRRSRRARSRRRSWRRTPR